MCDYKLLYRSNLLTIKWSLKLQNSVTSIISWCWICLVAWQSESRDCIAALQLFLQFTANHNSINKIFPHPGTSRNHGNFQDMDLTLRGTQTQASTQCVPASQNLDHKFVLSYHAQPNSPFFRKLPYELRVMIYRLLTLNLGTSVLHVYIPQPGPYSRDTYKPCVCLNSRCLRTEVWDGPVHTNSWGSLHFICRAPSRMNSEAVPGLKAFNALATSCRRL